jgi:hypothetical protein
VRRARRRDARRAAADHQHVGHLVRAHGSAALPSVRSAAWSIASARACAAPMAGSRDRAAPAAARRLGAHLRGAPAELLARDHRARQRAVVAAAGAVAEVGAPRDVQQGARVLVLRRP